MVVAMSDFLLLVDWMVVQEGILLRIASSWAVWEGMIAGH